MTEAEVREHIMAEIGELTTALQHYGMIATTSDQALQAYAAQVTAHVNSVLKYSGDAWTQNVKSVHVSATQAAIPGHVDVQVTITPMNDIKYVSFTAAVNEPQVLLTW